MNITLFHGTSKTRGKKILSDGCLKASGVNRVYDETSGVPTTDNQIYLAQNLATAVYYGQKTSIIYDRADSLYVFKMEINKNDILPDYDEVKYTINNNREEDKIPLDSLTVDSSLALTNSVAYPSDICVEDFSISYSELIILGDNNQKQLIDKLVNLRYEEFEKASCLINRISYELLWRQV